ncbi:hypothetical protein [Spirosoma arcticum]
MKRFNDLTNEQLILLHSLISGVHLLPRGYTVYRFKGAAEVHCNRQHSGGYAAKYSVVFQYDTGNILFIEDGSPAFPYYMGEAINKCIEWGIYPINK